MTIEERATRFVSRADAALNDLENASDIWANTIGSKSDEMRLHTLSIGLDNAIRKVGGKFPAWTGFDPSQVEAVAESGPIHLLWVISSHPSGRVREAFVHTATQLHSDQMLPHIANRSVDFVPAIRDLASPLLLTRLEEIAAQRADPGEPGENGVLPTSAHIVVKKLLSPRTAVLSPELVHACIGLAKTSSVSRPGALKADNLDRMLERCRQTLASSSDPASSEAVEALTVYFTENAVLGD